MVSNYKFNIGDIVYNNIVKTTGRVYAYDYCKNLYYVWYGEECIYNEIPYEANELSI